MLNVDKCLCALYKKTSKPTYRSERDKIAADVAEIVGHFNRINQLQAEINAEMDAIHKTNMYLVDGGRYCELLTVIDDQGRSK